MRSDLEQLANKYWNISQACNGRHFISIQDALQGLREVRQNTGEHRLLHQRASDLQGELIIHGGRASNDDKGGGNVEQI